MSPLLQNTSGGVGGKNQVRPQLCAKTITKGDSSLLAGLSDLLKEWPQFQQLAANLNADGAESVSILQSAKALLLGALWRELRVPLLVVSPQPDDARRLYDQLQAYWGEDAPLHHFTELEALPFERLAIDTATTHQPEDGE